MIRLVRKALSFPFHVICLVLGISSNLLDFLGEITESLAYLIEGSYHGSIAPYDNIEIDRNVNDDNRKYG